MNKKVLFALAMSAATAVISSLRADNPTPALDTIPNNTTVQTQLMLDVKDNTKEVHFIQTNNDPYVYTKVYVLKHADPYELRPYIINAVGGDQFTNTNTARRVNTNATKVECIKYMDGTGMLIVSAEDYRFTEAGSGMGLDKVIEILDQPKVTSSSRQVFTVYFPKYWTATNLATALNDVGLTKDNDPYELTAGKDRVRADKGLNALLIYTPGYSIKDFKKMLDLYDTPIAEAMINYTVYEVDSENDTMVGNDFQAWKNGPGSDLFAAGARYSNGWDVTNMTVARPYVNNSSTRFINFSPKWNTKYLDFLATKSKAQVLTSGSVSIMNSKTGYVGQTTGYANIRTSSTTPASTGIVSLGYYRLTQSALNNITISGRRASPDAAVSDTGNGATYTSSGVVPLESFYIRHSDRGTLAATDLGDFSVVRVETRSYTSNGVTSTEFVYNLTLGDAGSASNNEDFYFYSAAGKNLGKEIKLYDAAISNGGAIAYTTSDYWTAPMPIQKAANRVTNINYLGGTDGASYGFQLTMTPVVSEQATVLVLNMSNTNLIGFNSDGTPRTSASDMATKIHVSNKGEKFVVGGLDKESVVRSKGSVPYLGNIPVLGWAFTSEREVHKKSQLVAVIECIPVKPDTQVPASIMSEISAAKEKISNYGVKVGPFDQNDLGFDQYLLDSEKKGIDPLP